MTDVSVTTTCDNEEVVTRSVEIARVGLHLIDDETPLFSASVDFVDSVPGPEVVCSGRKWVFFTGAAYTAFINAVNSGGAITMRTDIDEHVGQIIQDWVDGLLAPADVQVLEFDVPELLEKVKQNLEGV